MGKAFNLRNGTILLSTEAPGGLYNAAQLNKIASLCNGEMAIVKATEDQRLALFVKEDQSEAIAEELKSIGLGIRHYQDGLHQPVTCIGELCPDHELDSLGSAMDLTSELAEIQTESSLKIGINGCGRCCVPCHTFDISIVADTSGYRMSLGGKNSQIPEMASFMAERIPPDKLVPLVKKVLAIFNEKVDTAEEETLQDVIDRCGASDFINALAPYSQDAADDDDPFAVTAEVSDESTDDGLGEGTDDSHSDDTDNSLSDDLGDLPEDDGDFGELSDDDGALDDLPEDDTSFDEGESEGNILNEGEIPEEQSDDDLGSESDEIEEAGEFDLADSSDDDLDDEITVSSDLEEDSSFEAEIPISEDDVGEIEQISPDGMALESDDLGVDDDVALEEEGGLEDDSLDDSGLEDDSLDDGGLEDDNLDDGGLEDDSLGDGGLEDDSLDDGGLEDDSLDDGGLEDDSLDDGGLEDDSLDLDEPAELSEGVEDVEDEAGAGDEDFDDVEGGDEEEFEAEINRGIEEDMELRSHENLDENLNERDAAFDMIESGEDGESGDVDIAIEGETELIDEDFDNVDLDDIDDDFDAVGPVDASDDENFLKEESINQDLVSMEGKKVDEAAHAPNAPSPNKPGHQSSGFSGVNFENGNLKLEFDSGAQMNIPLGSMDFGSGRTLTFGGTKVNLETTSSGTKVEVDGIEFFLPNESQAA